MERAQRKETRNCVEKLKALADESRLAILGCLLERPMRVFELSECLGIEQSLLSHHLMILREQGLVDSVRDGKTMRYRSVAGARGRGKDRRIDLGCCSVRFPRFPDAART